MNAIEDAPRELSATLQTPVGELAITIAFGIRQAVPSAMGTTSTTALRMERAGQGATDGSFEIEPPRTIAGRIERGGDAAPNLARFLQWFGDKRSPQSLRQYRAILDRFARETGAASMTDWTLGAVETWLSSKVREGEWSSTTHDRNAAIFRSLGTYWHTRGVTTRNDFAALDDIGEPGEEGAWALTVEQARALVQATATRELRAKKQNHPGVGRAKLYTVLWHTMIRPGELQKMPRKAVNLRDSVPHYVAEPSWCKCKTRKDYVPLADAAVEIFTEQMDRIKNGPDDPIFPHWFGGGSFEADREAAGISKRMGHEQMSVRPYSLKSGAVTWLRRAFDDGLVASLTRHSNGTQLDKYDQPSLESSRDVANKLPRILGTYGFVEPEQRSNPALQSENGPGQCVRFGDGLGSEGSRRGALSHLGDGRVVLDAGRAGLSPPVLEIMLDELGQCMVNIARRLGEAREGSGSAGAGAEGGPR